MGGRELKMALVLWKDVHKTIEVQIYHEIRSYLSCGAGKFIL